MLTMFNSSYWVYSSHFVIKYQLEMPLPIGGSKMNSSNCK